MNRLLPVSVEFIIYGGETGDKQYTPYKNKWKTVSQSGVMEKKEKSEQRSLVGPAGDGGGKGCALSFLGR